MNPATYAGSNLHRLALNGFNTAIRLLGKELASKSGSYNEIHVTSCLIAAFALIEPGIAPMVSTDPARPDLYGIMRGCFNVPSLMMNDSSKTIDETLRGIVTRPESLFPTETDVNGIDLESEELVYFTRLLAVLNDRCRNINLLFGPEDTSPVSTPSPSTYSSSLDNEDPYLTEDEIPVYRTFLYTLMHLALRSVEYRRPTAMIQAFNCVPDEFVRLLRANRPFAVVLAAHQLAQYEFVSRHPMYQGALCPRLDVLEASLPPEWRPALYWPRRILKERVYERGLGILLTKMGIPAKY